MKIVIDNAIPFIKGVFEPFAEVVYLGGGEFTPEEVRGADALVIRTRTKCNEELLAGSNVRLIATATIGFDHIDLEYCKRQGIEVTTAQGCNARGVLQWISAALVLLSHREGWVREQTTIGIVGVGNVGRLVKQYAESWGFRVLCCDPPRREKEGLAEFMEFEDMLPMVDVLTFHTPLNDTTRHMLNAQNMSCLKPNATIINTSRGEVIDSGELHNFPRLNLLFDVWEHEPNICLKLLDRAIVSTPHIAGYSLQGKANGTAMVVKSVAERFGYPLVGWYPDVVRNEGVKISWEQLESTIAQHFDIESESGVLKSSPEEFERLRNQYNYRKEYF